jgi:hypothetical protein
MLREKTSGRIHRVEAGGEVNGVKVVQIDPAAVTLGMGDERELVPLVVQRPGGAAPGAPQQAGAAPPVFAGPPGGPFGAQPSPFPQAAAAQPGTAPAPVPGAQPLARRDMSSQPPPPGASAPAAGAPGTYPQSAAPMTAEELLARRRARRAQQNQ